MGAVTVYRANKRYYASSDSSIMTFALELGASTTLGGSLAALGVLLFKGLGFLFLKELVIEDFKFPNITIFGVNFGRRRRDAGDMEDPVDMSGLLSLVGILDPDHCLPMALCTAAAIDPNNRTSEEASLLKTIGYTDRISPVPISELNSHDGHVQYALLVGSMLLDPGLCTSLVPECPLTPEQAIILLTSSNMGCKQMEIEDPLGNDLSMAKPLIG